MRFYCLLLLAAFATAYPALAQTGFVEQFIVEAKENKTYLRWTITAGNSCNGIEISRSTDAVNYAHIGEIFGVCGSADSAQTYLFTDNSPEKNKTNFYKLTFGTLGETAVQSVFVLADGEIILYPNPSSVLSKLYFDNSTAITATLYLYTLDGRLVSSMKTKERKFEINTSIMPGGLYLYVLAIGSKVHKGKLAVVH